MGLISKFITGGAGGGGGSVDAGDGLTQSGDTLAVGAAPDGSITVAADSISVGVLASDAQHGNRGGGSVHAAATSSIAGFMSAIDKARFDNLGSNSITFKPGATTGAGVVGTWAEVDAFANAAAGQWRLYLDGSVAPCEVPASADTDFRNLCIFEDSGVATNNTLVVKDGGVLRNINKIGFNAVVMPEAITTPGIVLENNTIFALVQGGHVGTTSGVTLVPPISVTATQLIIATLEGGQMADDGGTGVAVVEYTTTGGFHIIATLVNSTGSLSALGDNIIKADPTTTFFHLYDTTSRLGDQSTHFAGTIIYQPMARSSYLQWDSGDTASRPVLVSTGQMYFDTDLGQPIWWDGAAWVDASGSAA